MTLRQGPNPSGYPPVITLAMENDPCMDDLPEKITIWLFNIAMENGSLIDGLPIKNGDFHGYVK